MRADQKKQRSSNKTVYQRARTQLANADLVLIRVYPRKSAAKFRG